MSNSNIDRIKANLSITEVLSEYIRLQKSGSSLKARCPFHNEKTPSFYVSPDKGIYKCFGCGKSGDIFSFVQEYEGIEFKESLKKLASKAGVPLDFTSNKKDTERNILKNRLLKISSAAVFFWQKELYKNKEAIKYLKNRSIKKQTLIDFKIGLAPDDWRKTEEYLLEKGFDKNDILLTGITKKNEKGNIYDRFRNRIIFPIFSASGKTIAFSGRDLSGSDKVAKYLNSPATILFDKSAELFGFNFAKGQIRRQNYTIVTEGQFDIVLSHQNHFVNTVATSGTSLTEKHLQKIKNFSTNIIFAFDSDKAGIASAFRGTKLAIKNGFTVKLAKIPAGKDPADILSAKKIGNSKTGKQEWARIIKEAQDFLVFFAERILHSELSFEQKVKKMEEEILPLILEVSDPIIVEKYLKNISEGFGVSESSVVLAMEKVSKKVKKDKKKEEKYKERNNKYKNFKTTKPRDNTKNSKIKKDFNSSEFPEYNEDYLSHNSEPDHSQGQIYEPEKYNNNFSLNKSSAMDIKLEKKKKSTIIYANKKSKILEHIAKIYFLQKSLDTDKREVELRYIKKRFLEFLPEEDFKKFVHKYERISKSNKWDFEDILMEDNLLKTELDSLFSNFSKIFYKEEIKKLQEELQKFQFLNDIENIKETKNKILLLIKKLA